MRLFLISYMKKNKQSNKCCSVCKVLKSSSRSHSLFAHIRTARTEYLFTLRWRMAETYPIGDDSLSRSARRFGGRFAPLQKIAPKSSFLCVTKQRPYPVFFSCRHKSYPGKGKHCLVILRLRSFNLIIALVHTSFLFDIIQVNINWKLWS